MGFKRFDPEDLVISNDSVTSTVWSGDATTLTSNSMFSSSAQTASISGDYYWEVYQTESSDSTAAVQFSIAYCDKEGSGSEFYNSLVTGSSPTRTNYGQYRTLVLGDENDSFIFGDQTSSYFYVVNVNRARYKESLLKGTMTLELSGSGGEISITDDSALGNAAVYTDAGRKYNLVSGSAGTVYTETDSRGWTSNSGSYGWFLPDVGLLLLSGEALSGSFADGGIDLHPGRGFDTDGENEKKIFDVIQIGSNFLLNSKETLSSNYAFVNVKSGEFNYSENPSFISGSTGEVVFDEFVNNPTTYATTVGLYNDNNECIAVAKLSRPLPKDFTKGLNLRVKLDF